MNPYIEMNEGMAEILSALPDQFEHPGTAAAALAAARAERDEAQAVVARREQELSETIGAGVFQGKIVVRPHAQKTDGKMASHAVLTPGHIGGGSFVDVTPRRTTLPPIYNQYQRVEAIPDYKPEHHDYWPVFRPLFLRERSSLTSRNIQRPWPLSRSWFAITFRLDSSQSSVQTFARLSEFAVA